MSAFDEAFAPWQQRVYDQAVAAFEAGRLGHGLLLCGPARLGKRQVAERLAQRVLCRTPVGNAPCGRCRNCTLFLSRAQADPIEVRPDGALAHPWGHAGHPDAGFVGYAYNDKTKKPRSEIVIEQVRALSERLALTPQAGGAQIAILDPADAINHAAANALLKTLEEPVPGRYLWLVTAHPQALPATIRSRCQRLEFRLPPRAEALAWLQARGHAAKAVQEALDAARGHPGLADAWLRDGGLALRREVAGELAGLERGELAPVALAQRWTGDELVAQRLEFAADLALQDAARLTDPRRTRRLAAWFDAANRTRALLRTTVRPDLAVAELLLAWRTDAGAQAVQGRGTNEVRR
ncbi:MAG: DNA polymerase III subunit delta' [Lysobacter sp.]|nr:DNA polymerase III subunit delta' [Lysobacter sp.]